MYRPLERIGLIMNKHRAYASNEDNFISLFKQLAYSIFVGLVLVGCNSENSNHREKSYYTIPVKLGNSRDVYLSKIASTVSYIRLQTTKDCIVGSIVKLIKHEDRLLIWNGKRKSCTIFCFDIDGNFIYKLHNIGKGPGEYVGVQDVIFDKRNEQIIIYDASQAKLIKYSFNGDYLGEIKNTLLPMAVETLDSESFWFYSMGYVHIPGSDSLFNLLRVDKDGKTIQSCYLPFRPNLDMLFHQHAFYKDNDYLLFHYSFCDTIYNINNSSVNPFVFIDFNKSQELKALNRISTFSRSERNRIIQSENFAFIHSVLASDKYFFASFSNSSFLNKILFSFDSQKAYLIKHVINDIDGVPFILSPKILSGNKMILKINPIDIIEYLNQDADITEKAIPDALKNIKIDDNPILAIITLKKF